jgi:glycosyltransferase involved in cell wall biosynthesis
MLKDYEKTNGPVVSVLISTFNRSQSLYEALASVFGQSYKNLQVIVVNDGGGDVSDVIESFNESRLVYINRKENRGKAFSLNEALHEAKGKYIAYLDDDDIYYPFHIEALINALENETDCRVAYSDLYKTYCKVFPDGSRQILSKVVEVSRDFDRFFMLNFNHVLHVSLMHHRDLIEKTGPYNEQLNVLIDWDLTRRLAFFSDFYHIHKVTLFIPISFICRCPNRILTDLIPICLIWFSYIWSRILHRHSRSMPHWKNARDNILQ